MQYMIKEEDEHTELNQHNMLSRYISCNDQEYERYMDMVQSIKKQDQQEPKMFEDFEDEVFQSIRQVFRELQEQHDLGHTPMRHLERLLQERCGHNQQSYYRILRRLSATKSIVKRQKAKNRTMLRNTPMVEQPKEESNSTAIDQEKMSELKKKNRISAQISRDRKKQYIVQLEQTNRDYQLECQKLKEQNEELTRKLEKVQPSLQTNIFIRLLVFLGIFFLINLIKEGLHKGTSNVSVDTHISDQQSKRTISNLLQDVQKMTQSQGVVSNQIRQAISKKIQGFRQSTDSSTLAAIGKTIQVSQMVGIMNSL